MVKKLKELADGPSDDQLATMIRNSATQIWLAGLGAFSKGQEESGKLFDALVKEGHAVQKRTKRVAEEKVEKFRDKAIGTWDKLQHDLEQTVSRALQGLNVPTKKDIDQLCKRIAELTTVADKLSSKMGQKGRSARG